jgi:hypothetical protein
VNARNPYNEIAEESEANPSCDFAGQPVGDKTDH